jgi:GAF domain-containing protein
MKLEIELRKGLTMLTRIRGLLAPPIFEGDQDKTRVASLLNVVLWAMMAITAFSAIALLFLATELQIGVAVVFVMLVLNVGSLLLMHRGQVRFASMIALSQQWLMYMGFVFVAGGVDTAFVVGPVTALVMAGLLLGGRASVIVAGLSAVTGLIAVWLESNGLLPAAIALVLPVNAWLVWVVNLALISVLLYLSARSLDQALTQARDYGAELEQQKAGLEETVEERTQDLTRRTRYLEATATVARDAASVLDLQGQLRRVVNLVSEQFGFYHTGIFLLDPSGEWAVLQAASSEGGRRMLARNHRLRPGVGIVGYAVQRGEPRIALDVAGERRQGEDAVFFDNPDLPDTRSEMALPLRARGEIIGALDVQSTEPAAFGDEDVAVLQTLADQVAVAISNARLFEQAQESLAAEHRAYGEMSRAAWQELLRAESELGFLSRRRDTVPAGDLWRAEMKAAMHRGETTLGDGDSRTVAIPIKVSDQVIGVVDGRKPDGAGEWTPEEIELLEAMTEQLDVALEGARLYQDTQRRAARERLTREIADKMRRAADLDALMKITIQETAAALGTSDAFVQVATPPDSANDEGGDPEP